MYFKSDIIFMYFCLLESFTTSRTPQKAHATRHDSMNMISDLKYIDIDDDNINQN